MANSLGERPEGFCGSGEKRITEHSQVSNILADSCGERCGGKEWGGEAEEKGQSERHSSERSGDSSVGDTEHDGSHEAEIGRSTGASQAESGMLELERSDSLFWGSSQVIYCRDGKYRPIPTEPALFPLANGISNRVGILRGAGNAIVPQAAAEIIKAVM
jgi:DNA (cytosine-5)-methyltransferase 1